MSLPGVRTFSLCEPDFPGTKSNRTSDALRESGNTAWHKGDLQNALCLYTKALFYAETAVAKAFAFANRSCVLARVCADLAVVEDIDQAFQLDYPSDRRCRLYIRRAQSLLRLNRVIEARQDFHHAQQYLSTTYPKNFHHLVESGLKRCRERSTTESPLSPSDPALLVLTHGLAGPHISKDQSNCAASASPKFEVAFSDPHLGWQLVSTRTYKPGEFILLDAPYSRRLHQDRLFTHCYRCFRRSLNLLPCRGCSEVGFCSTACEELTFKATATNTTIDELSLPNHRYECGQIHRLCISDYACWKSHRSSQTRREDEGQALERLRSFLQSLPSKDCIGGPNISWLAYSCVAETTPRSIIQLVQGLSPGSGNSSGTLLAFTGTRFRPSLSESRDFASIGWLATNSDKRTPVDIWQRTVAAVFLTHCLSAAGYPLDWDSHCFHDPKADGPLAEDAKIPASWAAALLLHLLQAIASNAHAFTASVCGENQLFEPPTTGDVPSPGVDLCSIGRSELASCFYPILSLLNHSCNPNVVQVYMGNGLCRLYALRPIVLGQALHGNYGYHYATHPKSVRYRELREQYLFDCACEACFDNWPQQTFVDKVVCINCKKRIAETSDTGSTCSCSLSQRLLTQTLYTELVTKFRDHVCSIPESYLRHSVRNLPLSMVKEHIALLSGLLDVNGLERVMSRPSMPFDYTQEMLKLLLDLQCGCVEVYTRNTADVSSNSS